MTTHPWALATVPAMDLPGAARTPEVAGLHVTATRDGDTAIVVVAGEVDSACAGLLIEACDEQIEAGALAICLDLSDTSFVDSSGLVVLLDVRAVTANHGVALTLRRPSTRRPPCARTDRARLGVRPRTLTRRTGAPGPNGPGPRSDR